ncbi:MAG: molybdopterin-guanine dinucleotide biosynthesis protein MobA, partial [Armatimonadota bacterium]
MPEAFLLAAGESRRMGVPKPLVPFGDSTVLATMAHAFRAAGCSPITVVHRPGDIRLLEAVHALGL